MGMKNNNKKISPASSRGFKWGPFTARLPLLHMRVEWPELLQGVVVAASTGLALTPLLVAAFGLTFEEAITISIFHTILISSHVVLFGEPFAPGWVTPALPLALAFVLGGYDTPVERFQMMTALSLNLAGLMFFLGITGLGKKLILYIPTAIKAGIILGAALSAFKRVFVDDFKTIEAMPVSMTLALITCLVVSFSLPFQALKLKYKSLAALASLGLLPGFIIAGIVGTYLGEITFDIQWGLLVPPVGDLMSKVSPFYIGWPPLSFFIEAIPLAIITYTIVFGDLLTGIAIIREAEKARPDDKLDIDTSRSHIVIAIRNAVMGIVAPFFPTQGCLWTGVHVVVVQRWAEGKDKMETLVGGISAYYLYGVPFLLLFLPVVTFLKPFMPIALVLTLILTGFACAYVALSMPKGKEERGIMLLTAFFLVFFAPWVGLVIGILAVLLLLGTGAFKLKTIK
ncbi:hypothetical protein MNBD_ALPHA03-2160 [hydrothermal vent metagenome]|uniref:Xanthine permease n=1 Tax=hydrothermal vent metagenome TaxID=652676 RepID=A0A3B1B457_9ZZZZ